MTAPTAELRIGDVRDVLASLPDASVDLVLTSPPFLALRSYLPPGHPDKAAEMGSEPTPGAFLDALLDVVEDCRRVLTPHGTLAVELGDTYSGSGGAGGDYSAHGLRAGQPRAAGSGRTARAAARAEWPLAKSLCMVPESFRWALVYGRNPFSGRTLEPWRVRNVVRWCRPNPPVGALGDKFRPATSEMVIACTSGKRWFDLDAVRVPYKPRRLSRGQTVHGGRSSVGGERKPRHAGENFLAGPGAPPLDWWEIPTQPYKGSHYATWPERLLERPILAMCPERVCTTCGEPSRRLVGKAAYENAAGEPVRPHVWPAGVAAGAGAHTAKRDGGVTRRTTTLGWTDCGHDTWRPGVVLDPFAGSGTTLKVALAHGRSALGIDLDARNADLARARVGDALTVVSLAEVGA